MITEALQRLAARQNLSRPEARALLQAIFAGEGEDAQIAGLLMALAVKGETVEEIVGLAEAMRAAATDLGLEGQGRQAVDTCGTGGSLRHVFNVSTAAAFVAAGAGQWVAKHGNRTSTSVCGSADVLEAAGVDLAFPAERLGRCLRDNGIVFLFAPLLHSAMRRVMPARGALKVRTVFNILGPLTNPAGAGAQVVGVSSMDLLPIMAEALAELGTAHSYVVRSLDGLGEFSTTSPNEVAEVMGGKVRRFQLDAGELGLARATLDAFSCRSREEAVARMQAVLEGESGARREIVCLNAAAALVAGDRAEDFREGLELAARSIDSGAARSKLEALVAYTRTPIKERAEAAL